jgi:imidazolonepropionase-like amidohydrolase
MLLVKTCQSSLIVLQCSDLGSEAMQDADTNVRDAVNRGIIPGPRLFVATRPLAGTGGYDVHTENELGGSCCPGVAETFDGPHEARRAVRSRIAAGADVIKFYADYRRRVMRWPPLQQHPYISGMKISVPEPNPDIPILDLDEMQTIVREAYLARSPVACHAKTWEGIKMAVEAGVLSIEHGNWVDEELLQLMKSKGCIFVPTLAISERLQPQHIDTFKKNVKRAHEIGVRLAVGGDTGTFPHGQGIREAEIMIEAGIPLEDVLEACCVGGWESCGSDLCSVRFGWFEPGVRADIIAINDDPRVDYKAMRRVDFVMKDAQVWKQSSAAVNMIVHHHVWDM